MPETECSGRTYLRQTAGLVAVAVYKETANLPFESSPDNYGAKELEVPT